MVKQRCRKALRDLKICNLTLHGLNEIEKTMEIIKINMFEAHAFVLQLVVPENSFL